MVVSGSSQQRATVAGIFQQGVFFLPESVPLFPDVLDSQYWIVALPVHMIPLICTAVVQYLMELTLVDGGCPRFTILNSGTSSTHDTVDMYCCCAVPDGADAGWWWTFSQVSAEHGCCLLHLCISSHSGSWQLCKCHRYLHIDYRSINLIVVLYTVFHNYRTPSFLWHNSPMHGLYMQKCWGQSRR